ncbi:MAG: hypothetical protein ACOX40_06580 [Bacilli bacterium]
MRKTHEEKANLLTVDQLRNSLIISDNWMEVPNATIEYANISHQELKQYQLISSRK